MLGCRLLFKNLNCLYLICCIKCFAPSNAHNSCKVVAKYSLPGWIPQICWFCNAFWPCSLGFLGMRVSECVVGGRERGGSSVPEACNYTAEMSHLSPYYFETLPCCKTSSLLPMAIPLLQFHPGFLSGFT